MYFCYFFLQRFAFGYFAAFCFYMASSTYKVAHFETTRKACTEIQVKEKAHALESIHHSSSHQKTTFGALFSLGVIRFY